MSIFRGQRDPESGSAWFSRAALPACTSWPKGNCMSQETSTNQPIEGFEYRVYTQDGELLLVTNKYRIANDYALGYQTRTGETVVVKTNRKEN